MIVYTVKLLEKNLACVCPGPANTLQTNPERGWEMSTGLKGRYGEEKRI